MAYPNGASGRPSRIPNYVRHGVDEGVYGPQSGIERTGLGNPGVEGSVPANRVEDAGAHNQGRRFPKYLSTASKGSATIYSTQKNGPNAMYGPFPGWSIADSNR